MMPSKPSVTFLTVAIAATLILAGMPLSAQTSGGKLNATPGGDLSKQIATAKAQFASQLAQALSPDSIKAMLQLLKDAPADTDTDTVTASLTNFDDVSAPCNFIGTVPLRGREQFAGFLAPTLDGGAILNGCSNFGVNPHSPPNFLAFNNAASYDDGGVPKLPEMIFVGRNKSSVSLWVSGGTHSGFPIAMVALTTSGVRGFVTTTTAPDWVQLTIAGTQIQAILLVGQPLWLVVDDIQAQ